MHVVVKNNSTRFEQIVSVNGYYRWPNAWEERGVRGKDGGSLCSFSSPQ